MISGAEAPDWLTGDDHDFLNGDQGL